MRLALPIVWSDRHRRHDPGGEVWTGVRTPGTEVPRRAEAIRAAVERHGATFVDARAQPDRDLVAVHDAGRVEYVAGAWPRRQAARQPDAPKAPLAVTPAGFRAARRAPGTLGVPTVLVQDGGYDLTTIGALACETLAGVQEGPARA